ncbi:AraC family transcriptional regulator [Chryseolinea sp. H1M3-3]|uniref:helix-turn-helix domain-containing protein n=1 Tax=Chryseolinea sp. H1M3-3 TaxID=3034144 RepID=UPI0023EBDECB|nr:AraC family transcriptional regulator [Chryseolinea sp. H1M3-3]
MNQFTLLKESSRDLDLFPHIKEFALTKNSTIQLDSFVIGVSDSIQIYCVIDGKFEWILNQCPHTLYPGDIAFVLPGQEIGGAKGFLDIGTLYRLFIQVENVKQGAGMLGSWSSISESERLAIGNILLLNKTPVLKIKEAANILCKIRSEIMSQEIGYLTRVNHLIDSLFISVARQSTLQADSRRDFPRTFMKLERTLRLNLAHQWSVEEMAALFGLGTTSFTEKVKSFTGFSPMNYLINIRISEAIKLLKRADANFTNIALETGFYSSQHFSTTFKKLTGYTPGQFRKRNASQNTLDNPQSYGMRNHD